MQDPGSGSGKGAAREPDTNRLMRAIFELLGREHTGTKTLLGARVLRQQLIVRDYATIVQSIHKCKHIVDNTRIQLFDVNLKTLSKW